MIPEGQDMHRDRAQRRDDRFEGSNYALKTGPQMAAIEKMADRVQSGTTAVIGTCP